MEDAIRDMGPDLLKDMERKIREIERLVLDLKEMGRDMPVVEKNTRSILSFTHVLRFGISDVAGMLDREVQNGRGAQG
jgi:hypothetical protein